MIMKMYRSTFATICIAIAVASFFGGFAAAQPKPINTIADCILDGMKAGGFDKGAAYAIDGACRMKYKD
jgi:hypothetical protein